MAAAVRLLASQMEAMENSFLTIFFEAANKITESTDSKLFFMMETSDGIRKVGGNRELKYLFRVGGLTPRDDDVIIGDDNVDDNPANGALEESGIGVEDENGIPHNNGHKRKKDPIPDSLPTPIKRRKEKNWGKSVDAGSPKVEEQNDLDNSLDEVYEDSGQPVADCGLPDSSTQAALSAGGGGDYTELMAMIN